MKLRAARRVARAYLKRENAMQPDTLQRMPEDAIPAQREGALPVLEVWRSKEFLVQVYPVPGMPHMERLSVNRADIDEASGRWSDKITWDELQRLKRECGRGDLDAVEIYPKDSDVVNVANMRHLWVFKYGTVPFAWRPSREHGKEQEAWP